MDAIILMIRINRTLNYSHFFVNGCNMEVDCVSELNLNELIDLLGIDKGLQRYGAFDKTYFEYYGISLVDINDNTPFLSFGNISNEITIKKK